ncbi:hypothetical protein RintRC_3843 [Richelia intracellularis]|nr:hypothetical protein RintRC_3843 [Richelia intracellularis]
MPLLPRTCNSPPHSFQKCPETANHLPVYYSTMPLNGQ